MHQSNTVFMSDLDTPVLHQISRLLIQTKLGSRLPPSELLDSVTESEEENQQHIDNGPSSEMHHLDPHVDTTANKHYQIIGYCRSLKPELGTSHIPEDMKTDIHDLVGKSPSTRDLIDSINTQGLPAKGVVSVFQRSDMTAFENSIVNARIIIVDFIYSVDDVPFILKVLKDHAQQFIESPKILIGLSTVLTWGRTKPEPDSPDGSLSEDEYRRRKPHPNYRVHVALEKEWIQLTKLGCYHSYVVFQGLVYHIGNSPIHHMLRAAWQGQAVSVYGEGDNILPMIHLDDLCELVILLVETCPKSIKYIIAMDEAHSSYLELAQAISQVLGTGKLQLAPKEQALLEPSLDQFTRDCLGMNLRFESTNIKQLNLNWKYRAGLVPTLPKLIEEYRRGRGLTPIKILLLGPPKIGKTYYAQKLARHYQLAYVNIETVMTETINRLRCRVNSDTTANPNGEEGFQDTSSNNQKEDEVQLEGEKQLLEELLEYSKNNAGNFQDSHILSFLRAKLADTTCQNQGYVLDGYPLSRDQAIALFRRDENDESVTDTIREQSEGILENVDLKLIPNHLVALDAPDDWISDMCMQLSESKLIETNMTEDEFNLQLKEYRTQNTDDITVLNYFDELEIHPSFFNVATGACGAVCGVMALVQASTSSVHQAVGSARHTDITDQLLKIIGKPHNYGPSVNEIQIRQKQLAHESDLIAQKAQADLQRQQNAEQQRHAQALENWNAKIEEVKRQEHEVLEAQSLPLRDYLMQHIMPTLSQGLLETCKIRPEDPVDFLAEYLFRHAEIEAAGLSYKPLSSMMPASQQPDLPHPTEFPRSSTSRPTSVKNSVPLPPISVGSANQTI